MPRLKITGLVVLLVVATFVVASQVSSAQDEADCDTLLSQTIQLVQETCNGLEPGNACTASGSTIPLGDMDSLQTALLDLEANQWEPALIKLPTDGQPINMAVFGGAEIIPIETNPDTVFEPFQAANKTGYNVNLRQGPGKDFEVAGFFGWDKTANVDGRSADGEWLRLQTASGHAWIAANLVSVQGDISSLPVVSGDTTPMPSFTLSTPNVNTTCGGGTAGVLVSHTGSEDVGLQVNGANLRFENATLLLQAQPNARLDIYVIEGAAEVGADGEAITANQGEAAQVALAGSDGLAADAPPLVKPSYPLNMLIGIPLELVSKEGLNCTTGVIDTEAGVSAFAAPTAEADVSSLLVADAHYPVTGWAQDSDGNRWWRLEVGWVRQDSVQTAGNCDDVAEVDGNAPVTTATTNMSTNTGAAESLFDTSLVPSGETIWYADPGQDILSGTCVTPPLPVCPHPAAVMPNGATLTWRGQEPLPYTLRLSGDNSYSYSGRNNLNNADVTMALTFTSPTTWTMTMTQVFDNDPTCVHTVYYNAVPR